MRKFGIITVLCILIVVVCTGCTVKNEDNVKNRIVTSFYPIYIMALNILDGVAETSVENMTDTTVGCLHNYTLQTSDLKKLENADVFIRNGLGLESFIDKVVIAYPNLEIVDASKANLHIIEDEDEKNGHVWTSIENYKKQINYIAETLGQLYPENKEKFTNNAREYISKIEQLTPYKAEEGTYAISCNEELSYLLREANLQVVPVYTDHDESSLSSGKIAEVVNIAIEHNIKAIFIDKNDNEKNARILANETGAEIVKLDSGLTGQISKDSYINAMKYNFSTLEQTFAK